MSTILFSRDLPTFALDTIRERVEKVNKRAIRHGFPLVSVATTGTSMRDDPYFQHDPLDAVSLICECTVPQVEYTTVTITASGPLCMDGWTLVGVVATDAIGTDGQAIAMVTTVPGQEFKGTITDGMLCEHCNTRRYRTETFILRGDNGRVVQVGRQCIRDFLGHDGSALLNGFNGYMDLVVSDDEAESWGRSAPVLFTISDIVNAAARIVSADGWYVSKAKALASEDSDKRVFSTASRVMDVLRPFSADMRKRVEREYPVSDQSIALADATMTALSTLRPSNDWEYRLAEFTNIAQVGARHIGVLASSVILGSRTIERAAKVVEKAAGAPSVHFGTVGGKIVNIPATITFTKTFEGQYGMTTIIKMATEQGNAVWFASGVHNYEQGTKVVLSGTVKKHDVERFDGSPVTVLTRCKIGA